MSVQAPKPIRELIDFYCMLPAVFLCPGDILIIDIQDIGVKSDSRDKVREGSVDKDSEILTTLLVTRGRSGNEASRRHAYLWASSLRQR